MRKFAALIIVLLGIIYLFLLQGCATDKPFVYSGDDLKKIDFIKVVRQETPAFRLDTPGRRVPRVLFGAIVGGADY